jgi:hypothetical protein
LRVLFWYCEKFAWNPTIKTLEDVPDANPDERKNVVVAFVHVEPKDIEDGSSAETKLVKNAKWLARKWDVKKILLHSFTHLAEEKADPDEAKSLLDRVQDRLRTYHAIGEKLGDAFSIGKEIRVTEIDIEAYATVFFSTYPWYWVKIGDAIMEF